MKEKLIKKMRLQIVYFLISSTILLLIIEFIQISFQSSAFWIGFNGGIISMYLRTVNDIKKTN